MQPKSTSTRIHPHHLWPGKKVMYLPRFVVVPNRKNRQWMNRQPLFATHVGRDQLVLSRYGQMIWRYRNARSVLKFPRHQFEVLQSSRSALIPARSTSLDVKFDWQNLLDTMMMMMTGFVTGAFSRAYRLCPLRKQSALCDHKFSISNSFINFIWIIYWMPNHFCLWV